MKKEELQLKTAQQIWDRYCELGNFEQGIVDDDTASWINALLPNYTDEEFDIVLRKSSGSPAYAVFDDNYFKAVLKSEQLEKEVKDMKSVDRTSANQLDLLTKTVASMMTEEVKKVSMSGLQDEFTEWVKSTYGPSYTVPKIYSSPSGNEVPGVTNKAFDDVAMWIACDVPVMLTGAAGTGKNKLVQQLGTYFDMPVLVINSIQDASELQGYKTIDGSYADTPFIVFSKYCMENDKQGIVLFDEIDNGDASAMVTVNDAIASREITLADNSHVDLHNIRFMANGNTWGTGATDEYVGRNQLDAATLNRFVVVEVDYDERVEDSICADKNLLHFLQQLRHGIRKCGIKHIISYRNIEQAVKAYHYKEDELSKKVKARILKQCVFKNLTSDDLNMLYPYIEDNEYVDIMKMCANEEY